MPYNLSEEAATDLEDIYFYGLIQHGLPQADKYEDSLYRAFELLAEMPTLGRSSERDHPKEHRWRHGSHVIYYRIEPNYIVIENIISSPTITDIWGGV